MNGEQKMQSIEPMGWDEERTRLLRNACGRLRTQRFVPISPGMVDGGEILLCAGAALVREAVAMRRSEREGEEFAYEVVDRESSYIWKVGERMGLDPEMVSDVIVTNDCLPARQRLAGVFSRLGWYRETSAEGVGVVVW